MSVSNQVYTVDVTKKGNRGEARMSEERLKGWFLQHPGQQLFRESHPSTAHPDKMNNRWLVDSAKNTEDLTKKDSRLSKFTHVGSVSNIDQFISMTGMYQGRAKKTGEKKERVSKPRAGARVAQTVEQHSATTLSFELIDNFLIPKMIGSKLNKWRNFLKAGEVNVGGKMVPVVAGEFPIFDAQLLVRELVQSVYSDIYMEINKQVKNDDGTVSRVRESKPKEKDFTGDGFATAFLQWVDKFGLNYKLTKHININKKDGTTTTIWRIHDHESWFRTSFKALIEEEILDEAFFVHTNYGDVDYYNKFTADIKSAAKKVHAKKMAGYKRLVSAEERATKKSTPAA